MQSSFVTLLLIFATIAYVLAGCADSDERFDSGYNDGYAVGYNTTCEIRATLVEGDWDNADYKRGYDFGYLEGAEACRTDRENDQVR